MKNNIIDNVNNLWGDDLKESLTSSSRLKISASCFSIYAYEALKKELLKIKSLEFIFTLPTFVPDDVTDKIIKHHREFHIPKLTRERDLYGNKFEIHLKNKLTQRAIAKECAQWIKEKVTFKSSSLQIPMQQFACVVNNKDSLAYVPINGFTAVDLGYQKSDAVSNFVNRFDENQNVKTYLQLFEQIWNDEDKLEDVTEHIISHIDSVYKENPPERIYFLMLYNIFNEFLEDLHEDVLPNDKTGYRETVIWNKLFNFQKDAATGIINKLEKFNGCVLADSVGLGKTFTALAVIKYYELRNRSVLVLCPKKLADNWLNYNHNLKTNSLVKDRFNYEVLCHTDLQRTRGESFGTQLNRVNWGNYDLVVIDESHNFRNNDAFKDRETRYQRLMNQVIRAGVKTKVLMLSATPVNNRFADLRNQLALAYEGESENLRKILSTDRSIEEIFKNAQVAFNKWSKLAPELRTSKSILESLDFDFFTLLDSVTIARSRKHIEKYYDTTDIGDFPARRKPLAYRCKLTNRSDVINFNEIYESLSRLNLSVYAPISFILPSRLKKYEQMYDTDVGDGKSRFKQIDRERSLKSLMTSNLLKRLESSVHAFRLTLEGLYKNNTVTLNKIIEFEKGQISPSFETKLLDDELLEYEDEDFTGLGDFEIGNKIKIDLRDMDVQSWRHELEHDISVISDLLAEMNKVSAKDDVKLQDLIKRIENKISNPINPGNKKILVFTAFADTANYLYDNLSPELLKNSNLHTGRVSGSSEPKTTLNTKYDFQSVLTLFAPLAKEKKLIMPEEYAEIDLLIATDCISEGQNLQDCDYLINYDIHWNPVRIVQRFGRIDRIGSPNKEIQLVNYWPDISLDEYINLKDRVESRMIMVDMSATASDNVLKEQSSEMSYRKEQLRRLQDEVIELEDLKTGVNITDLGLNDFRMDLLRYLKENPGLQKFPGGMHAVIAPNLKLGLKPGIIFTLKNRHPHMGNNLQNRLHPFYLVYIGDNAEVLVNYSEEKHLLDIVRTCCKDQNRPVMNLCDSFNKQTNDGRDMHKYSMLLDKTINSMIELKEQGDIESLFSKGKTTALTNTIAGIEDFELISFLVIHDEHDNDTHNCQ